MASEETSPYTKLHFRMKISKIFFHKSPNKQKISIRNKNFHSSVYGKRYKMENFFKWRKKKARNNVTC
jgi:hypothetical protein